jgi:hypothetical protein
MGSDADRVVHNRAARRESPMRNRSPRSYRDTATPQQGPGIDFERPTPPPNKIMGDDGVSSQVQIVLRRPKSAPQPRAGPTQLGRNWSLFVLYATAAAANNIHVDDCVSQTKAAILFVLPSWPQWSGASRGAGGQSLESASRRTSANWGRPFAGQFSRAELASISSGNKVGRPAGERRAQTRGPARQGCRPIGGGDRRRANNGNLCGAAASGRRGAGGRAEFDCFVMRSPSARFWANTHTPHRKHEHEGDNTTHQVIACRPAAIHRPPASARSPSAGPIKTNPSFGRSGACAGSVLAPALVSGGRPAGVRSVNYRNGRAYMMSLSA